MEGRILAALAALFVAAGSQAATLLDETATIAGPTSPSVVVREFDVASAAALDLTVTEKGYRNALYASLPPGGCSGSSSSTG